MKHAFFLFVAAVGLCSAAIVPVSFSLAAAPQKHVKPQSSSKQAPAVPFVAKKAGTPKTPSASSLRGPAGKEALPAPVAPETSAAEEDAYRRLLQSDPDELGAQAQKGDLDALHALGMRYILYGTEDPQNNERGAALLRQAAEAGHVQAQLDYAGWFSLQKTMSNPANARARQSYRTQMIFWLEKAGENPAATPGQQSAAWTALGSAWENENSPTGKENAAYWYQRCVNSGFAGSEAALGSLYAKTAASNAHDRQAAQLWLSRAFRKGDNSVLYRLGMLYTIHPEATDRAKACFWLHLAVKEAFAQRNTAEANQAKDSPEHTPAGVAPHMTVAAANRHVKNMQSALAQLEAKMTEEEKLATEEYLRVYYTLGRAPSILR